jgi:hypothetical protein
MSTVIQIKTWLAAMSHRTTVNDLNPSNWSPAGPNIDLGLVAVNSARRYLERAHDFKYSETNVFVSIPAAGGLLTACYATSALTPPAIGVKRVSSVSLPVASSGYQPIEFMTEDEWVARIKRQIGRQPYNASLTLTQLGVTANMNPVCYQQGQTLFLDPSPGTPTAQLNVTRWMADYTADADTDFFTDRAPEALQWQALIELNKLFRVFVPKQESNVDEASLEKYRDEALQSLIAWDISTARGTSTPDAQAPKKG